MKENRPNYLYNLNIKCDVLDDKPFENIINCPEEIKKIRKKM